MGGRRAGAVCFPNSHASHASEPAGATQPPATPKSTHLSPRMSASSIECVVSTMARPRLQRSTRSHRWRLAGRTGRWGRQARGAAVGEGTGGSGRAQGWHTCGRRNVCWERRGMAGQAAAGWLGAGRLAGWPHLLMGSSPVVGSSRYTTCGTGRTGGSTAVHAGR